MPRWFGILATRTCTERHTGSVRCRNLQHNNAPIPYSAATKKHRLIHLLVPLLRLLACIIIVVPFLLPLLPSVPLPISLRYSARWSCAKTFSCTCLPPFVSLRPPPPFLPRAVLLLLLNVLLALLCIKNLFNECISGVSSAIAV